MPPRCPLQFGRARAHAGHYQTDLAAPLPLGALPLVFPAAGAGRTAGSDALPDLPGRLPAAEAAGTGRRAAREPALPQCPAGRGAPILTGAC